MGNSTSVEPDTVIEQISTSENEDTPIIAQNCCMKNVIYIKKHFYDSLLPQQRRRLTNLERVIQQFTQSCQNIGISQQQHEVLFKSVHQQLKSLRRQIQNMWKKGYSDYQALLQKMQRQNLEKLQIFDIIEIPKCNQGAPSLIDLNNINFPILSYSNKNLCYLAGLVFKNTPFVAEQSIKSSKIDSFIETICLNYNVTGYHNFSHAFSVFLMTNQSYTLSNEIKQYINSQELFFILIACISHDLNHKGRNNAYYIKRKAECAITYSNQAVLQNMHISKLFKLLDQRPSSDILDFKDAAMKAKGRKIIIKSILATDMTTHFSSLHEFKQKCEATTQCLKQNSQKLKHLSFQKDRQSDRQIIMQIIIHACDIGNPCYQTTNYLNWAALLAQQFNEQHKRQIAFQYQPTPMLKYVDQTTFYKGQIGFCKHLVLPLWKQLSVFSSCLKLFSQQIEENIAAIQLKI